MHCARKVDVSPWWDGRTGSAPCRLRAPPRCGRRQTCLCSCNSQRCVSQGAEASPRPHLFKAGVCLQGDANTKKRDLVAAGQRFLPDVPFSLWVAAGPCFIWRSCVATLKHGPCFITSIIVYDVCAMRLRSISPAAVQVLSWPRDVQLWHLQYRGNPFQAEQAGLLNFKP